MRIVYVSQDPGIPVFGTKGASVHVQEMLRAFLRLGAEVTLLTPRLGGAAPSDLADVRVVAVDVTSGNNSEERAQSLVEANGQVARILSELEAVAPVDLVYERHALFASAAMPWAKSLGVASVLEVNAPLLDEQHRHRGLPLPEVAERMTHDALSSAGTVAAVSRPVANYAFRHGARTGRLHVVSNAIDPERFKTTRPPGQPFTVGFLGTLRPWHDLETLVGAMEILRDRLPVARLLIVGDGPVRERLAPRLAKLNAEVTGMVAPEAVPLWLTQMDAAVAAYPGDQPFYFSPLKLYEYMAAALPVVVSDVGDLATVIADEKTGLLCRPDDAAALADALERLARAPELADRLGKAAREHVVANHTWEGNARRVLALAASQKDGAAGTPAMPHATHVLAGGATS